MLDLPRKSIVFEYQSAMVYLDLDRLNDFQQTALKVNQTGLLQL